MEKEVILVGTFHFEQHPDIIQRKEREIKELVDVFRQYKPDKVALEWERTQEDELNALYQESDRDLSIDELQQIGFRLARQLKHKKVFAVNWAGTMTEQDVTDLHKAVENAERDIQDQLSRTTERYPEINENQSVYTSYRQLNAPSFIRDVEEMYLSFIGLHDESDEAVGLRFLNKWSEREHRIFKHVSEMTDSGERVLLLIGSDHLWTLRRLFEGSGWNVITPFEDQEKNE
ncbi:DUF5694 domain-containing protein [Halobacillus litoralis]|uniref:DUF5694 domain-containing protein n=1 Tax=Halobacillus litoralis TaxID=45668 RepID=UPI001CD2C37D|nr:DUF5694 domain-containing protein [Halobacillus litoralis]MCA0969320.1 DUF5694 domain-containing protein [Halobacillus litoralis]